MSYADPEDNHHPPSAVPGMRPLGHVGLGGPTGSAMKTLSRDMHGTPDDVSLSRGEFGWVCTLKRRNRPIRRWTESGDYDSVTVRSGGLAAIRSRADSHAVLVRRDGSVRVDGESVLYPTVLALVGESDRMVRRPRSQRRRVELDGTTVDPDGGIRSRDWRVTRRTIVLLRRELNRMP